MPLPSFFQRKTRTDPRAQPPGAPDSGPVQEVRIRARRRLAGAVVLLAVGIVGFPLVFETQPRAVPVDVRIEAAAGSASRPGKGSDAAALAQTAPAPTLQPAADPAASPLAGATPAVGDPAVITETRADAGRDVTPPAPAAGPSAPARAAAGTDVAVGNTAAQADDGAKARALLDGAPAVDPKSARFIVQVGAYTDSTALREARQRVEKLGLKTYTQVIDSEAGKRTRVRVGPFASREEADRTSARLKSAGLPVAVLVL